jgi:poly-gamma-glutamate capsule biosynthesis protein CapA/YwtB (metallophosphatase superfamily)
MKKIILTACIALAISGFLFFFPLDSKAKSIHDTRKDVQATAPVDSVITLVAVGDMMLGTNYPSPQYLPPAERLLLEPMFAYLRDADVTFGNLEGTVLNEGGNVKQCGDPSKCYAFRQPEYVVGQLKDAGFDILSIANNHMGDFGDPGRQNTQRILEEKGFTYAGLDSCPWDTVTIEGVKYGFTAFAPNTACLQINDYARAQSIVKQLDALCDIVIVSFHGGAEGSSRTHVTRQTEIFYGEDRGNVHQFARKVIDAGADVVLGHGPHVTRSIDCYKGRFITYSMGNFCTYGRFNLKGISGTAPLFQLKLNRDGSFISGTVVSTKQEGEGGPLLDPLNGALEQIKALAAQDVPELKVIFGEAGSFHFE